MRTVFEHWWQNGNKYFGILNYKKVWKENGIKPQFSFRTNGASKRRGDKCLDCTLIIGYTILNYVNFALN